MRKVIPIAVAGGVLLSSGGVFGAAQAFAKEVHLTQDGVPSQVRTWDGTVGQVLANQGIELGEHDVVAPALHEQVEDGQQISVRYGRELRLMIDGRPETLWTTSTTVEQALAESSIRDESTLSTSRNATISREGMAVEVETAKKLTLQDGGQAREVITPAETVGDVLREANVQTGPETHVEPAVETPVIEGMTIAVGAAENKQVDIPFETVRKETADLDKGAERVETKGVPGKAVEKWVERFENGQSVGKHKAETRVEREPVAEVRLVGTRPTSNPAPSANAAADLSPAQGASCIASNYSDPQPTASGEQFNPSAMTAAHKTLPLGSKVKVTNPKNGKTVIVRINDRGPYVAGRCLDLSSASFAAIGDLGQGVMTVNYQAL